MPTARSLTAFEGVGMLIGPNTTIAEIDAEITFLNQKAKRLPRSSDVWVHTHAELNRLITMREAMRRRDAVHDG